MKHNFQKSLAVGKAGEQLLLSLWPELVPIDGRKGDFTLGPDKVEVKSDQYDMNKTPNFFWERFSNEAKQSPGSVWQSLEHGCNILVYWYPKNKTAFVFDTVILKNVLESIIPELNPIRIPNTGYYTIGYKIPRDLVAPYAIEVKIWR